MFKRITDASLVAFVAGFLLACSVERADKVVVDEVVADDTVVGAQSTNMDPALDPDCQPSLNTRLNGPML
ncbi:MAG: hypothetical protein QF790_01085, partial [Gammaproteobacteria bacterium]|nr:hypothetical protein [Gammaproteobacteria bacterium]